MSISPEPDAPGLQVDLWRRRTVRAIALCALLAILVPWYAAVFRDFGQRHDGFELLIPILFFPLWLPYVWVIRGLRSNANARTVKKALAVAVGCSSLIFIVCTLLLLLTSFDADRQLAIAYSLIGVLQIALFAGAATTYYSMKREPDDLRILLARLWVPTVGVAGAVIVVPNVFLHEGAHYEASSVGALRTINTAEVEYARTHPDRGFSSTLAELGPDSADLIDPVLASGTKSGYILVLTAAPPDSRGHIAHYTVIARPKKYGREGKHSFLTDESGAVHFTTEDRAPTTKDPILQ